MAVLPQYNGPGRNNGDLRIYTRAPDRYGFASVDTITHARDELIAKGFLQVTRMGGMNSRYQYALSWVEIDPVAGIEVKASSMPSHLWRDENANQRELRVPGKKRKSKNENPVPTIGTTRPMTVPAIGTRASAIVPTIGTANTDKQRLSEHPVVPKIGTDSWVAMGGCADAAPAGATESTRAEEANQPIAATTSIDEPVVVSLTDMEPSECGAPNHGGMDAQHPVVPMRSEAANEYDRSKLRWLTRRERLVRAGAAVETRDTREEAPAPSNHEAGELVEEFEL